MEITRRDFVKWSLLTGAAIGLAGCAIPPNQALVSQIEMPETRLPGVARWFASTCQECEGGCGVSVRVIAGRGKKIEGIPEHPVNHGKICAKGHSALQALYNPDRLTGSWQKNGDKLSPVQDPASVTKELAKQLDSAAQNPGSLLWIVKSLSGSRGALIAHLAEKTGARLWVLDFHGSLPERLAMKSLAGKPEFPYYDLQDADYVVNFGSDFLMSGRSPVHSGWAYGEFRQGKQRRSIGRGIMISFSPRANLTTANSDKWIPCNPGSEGWVALGIGNLLSETKKGKWPKWASEIPLETISKQTGVPQDIFKRVAAKLSNERKPLAIAGFENGVYSNGVWSVWMIQSLNQLFGSKSETFETCLLPSLPNQRTIPEKTFVSTKDALSGLGSGKFQSVWVFDANPRHILPTGLNFESLFAKAKNKVVFSPYMSETALLADLIVATRTWMEEWGDRLIAAPYGINGKKQTIYNLQQPVAQVPDWSGSADLGDLLLQAAGQSRSLKAHASWNAMRDLLKSRFHDEKSWETLLARGGVWEEYPLDWEVYGGENNRPYNPPQAVKPAGKAPAGISPWSHLKKIDFSSAEAPRFNGDANGQVLIPFYSNLGDGSMANRPWMQQMQDPMVGTMWNTWIELPIPLARSLGVARGDVVELSSASGKIQGPAFPNPGLHPDAVAVPVGQGHFAYGQYADNRGANALSILNPVWQKETGEPAWASTRVAVRKTGETAPMIMLDTRNDRLPVEVLTL